MKALILAGGSGTRFWPLSRARRPKQLLGLEGGASLLAQTADRLRPLVEPQDIWVCTTAALADGVRQELPDLPSAQILAEPEGRDTAPAIAWSLDRMAATNDVVAVLPADHRVGRPESFRATLAQASAVVERDDRVMTLGVMPRWPETGYGYLELGEELDGASGLRSVSTFKEKPDAETAQRYVESGNYLWNAGIFVFRGGRLLDLISEYEPDISRGLAEMKERPKALAELYARLPRISIDFAVMERTRDLATLALDCAWSDLGSWAALAEVLPTDERGNAALGQVLELDASDNLLVADSGTVAAVGVSGLVVVRTGDAVLVIPKKRAQDVKQLVDLLRSEGRTDLL